MLKPSIKGYPPRYTKKDGNKYLYPHKGESLIPPRIRNIVLETGNTLDWKIDTLNEKEKHYRKVIRANKGRVYPVWARCFFCQKEMVLLISSYKKRCEKCRGKIKKFD